MGDMLTASNEFSSIDSEAKIHHVTQWQNRSWIGTKEIQVVYGFIGFVNVNLLCISYAYCLPCSSFIGVHACFVIPFFVFKFPCCIDYQDKLRGK